MSAPNKFFDVGNCAHAGCQGFSLPLSKPPACWVHLPSPNDWYESYEGEVRGDELDPESRHRLLSFAHEYYRQSLVKRGVAQELHEDFERRLQAGKNIAFSLSEIIFFVCAAAASGVIGGLSFEATKRLIARIASRNEGEVEPLIETILPEARYNELRAAHSSEIVIEAKEVIEQRLTRTYKLCVRRFDSSSRGAQ